MLPNIIATQNLSSPHAASPPLLIEKTIRRGPENYQSIRYLGRGAFGSVVLAEEKTTRRQYAMKVIDKSKIKEFNVLQSGVMQKLSLGNPEMLVPIKETFQNKNYIYIIM